MLRRAGAIWYAGLSLGIAGMTTIDYTVNPLLFRRFIGQADPTLMVIGISALGAVLLSLLVVRDGFAIAGPNVGPGVARSAGLAALFGTVVIVADLAIVHPADMNVPFPQSLLFYPAIGFMVEILFHLLPLCLLLTVLAALLGHGRSQVAVWISVIVVALLEPAFQIWTAATGAPVVGGPHTYPGWAVACDGLQVFGINLCQLLIFKRYDFVSMYALRLAYYGIWHIAWGYARLQLLF
jgi:hypothetical protein